MKISHLGWSEPELLAVNDVMRSSVVYGEGASRLEEKIASFLGVSSALCVSSSFSALLIILRSLSIGPGDEVVVPALTEPVIVRAIQWVGATPIFCDVEESHLLLNVKDAQPRITDRTKAIVYSHFTGRMSNIRRFYWLAENYNLRMIEDASHSFGSRWNGILCASFGDITLIDCADKNLSLGSGGVVLSSDVALAAKMREASIASDARINDLSAAIGVVQLARLNDEISPARVSLAARYEERLREVEGVSLIKHSYDGLVPVCYAVRVPDPSRAAKIRERLGVSSGVVSSSGLSVAERLSSELLLLPVHPTMTIEEQDAVLAAFSCA